MTDAQTTTRLELPFTPPFDVRSALATLAAHAIPGAEVTDVTAATHTRLLPTQTGPVAVTVGFTSNRLTVTAQTDAVSTARLEPLIRAWFDLDADPARVRRAFRDDPVLARHVAARPGLRVIGYPDGFEAAVTTVLGQQVSVAACRTFAGRLTAAFGDNGPGGLLVFPTPDRLAAASATELQQAVGLTHARTRSVLALSEACADGLRIAPDSDHADTRRRLLALPGIGEWSADYLAVRALGDRDAFVPGDLVLRRALGGISTREAKAASLVWSPLRAYALFQLWTATAYAA